MVHINDHFQGKEPEVETIYAQLLLALRQLGPVDEQPKKTSIHLVNRTGFAGVHTRQNCINLEFKSESPIQHPRIRKSQQISANRYHLLVQLQSAQDVDAQLLTWLEQAYCLSS
ncbi:MAG: DUF5655 domain-containing protein [Candidatus Promineifilaceae bacterium]|nr:DNA replication protein DnaC [Chloroflexota bacterium]